MKTTERERELYSSDVEVVKRDDRCTVYRISNTSGAVEVTNYRVFQGIELNYNDAHIQRFSINSPPPIDTMEINYCQNGRIEFEMHNKYTYLSQGDMYVYLKNGLSRESYFPFKDYRGISILIDLRQAPRNMTGLLDDYSIDVDTLEKKYCNRPEGVVIRANLRTDHVFSELYNITDKQREGYLKLKVLEVLLFLSDYEICNECVEPRYYTSAQVKASKKWQAI